MSDYEIVRIGEDEPDGVTAAGSLLEIKTEPTSFGPIPTPADNVEYDILMPGGGTETVPAGTLDAVPDVMLLAKRRLMQLKMVTVLLKRQKRRIKLAEAAGPRQAKSRKRNKLQKASRKKNR